MSAPEARAEAFTLAWARLYTRGLSHAAAQRRLRELGSDCFEQRRWGGEIGASPIAVAASMVTRTLAGMPADLLWRQAQIATSRDGSLEPRGRPMGRWLKDNWWIALGGLVGVFLIVLGVSLPFEDRTIGAWIGGAVHAALGLTMLAGIRLRRARRRRGDVMIAGGTLALMPWVWTIVLPVVGLLVLVPALLDAADADATGDDASARTPVDPARGGDPWTRVFVGILVAAVVAAAVIGQETPAVVLVAAPLSLLIAHLLLRRMRTSTAIRLGATLVASDFINGIVVMGAVVATGDGLDLGGTWGNAVNAGLGSIGLIGLVLLVVGWVASRRDARPA